MSDETFLVNDGNSVKQVPVEAKEPTLPSTPSSLDTPVKRERTELEKQVDAEIIAKGVDAIHDFDETQAIVVTPKKRGRKPGLKKNAVLREFYCATCRERITDANAMKIPMGEGRFSVFCPVCQKSLGIIDDLMLKTVADLIKNNPTGK